MMAAKLNKVFFYCIIFVSIIKAQKGVDYSDYKSQSDHQKFFKTRRAVAACQIEKLNKGALVVVLKDNQLLINVLVKANNQALAQEKFLSQFVINKNILVAFKSSFTFSKVYFIYSSTLDSLNKGVRKNIFLDTTLTVNSEIELKENDYFLCFRDYVYNSSIGFVKEDSAKFVSENGNPGGTEYFVIKNKYGHQLKKPFPFYNDGIKNMYTGIKGKIFEFQTYFESSLTLKGTNYFPNSNYLAELKEIKEGKRKPVKYVNSSNAQSIKISKDLLFEILQSSVASLNEDLKNFYLESKVDGDKAKSKEFDKYCY